jgi:hypothetical protein
MTLIEELLDWEKVEKAKRWGGTQMIVEISVLEAIREAEEKSGKP